MPPKESGEGLPYTDPLSGSLGEPVNHRETTQPDPNKTRELENQERSKQNVTRQLAEIKARLTELLQAADRTDTILNHDIKRTLKWVDDINIDSVSSLTRELQANYLNYLHTELNKLSQRIKSEAKTLILPTNTEPGSTNANQSPQEITQPDPLRTRDLGALGSSESHNGSEITEPSIETEPQATQNELGERTVLYSEFETTAELPPFETTEQLKTIQDNLNATACLSQSDVEPGQDAALTRRIDHWLPIIEIQPPTPAELAEVDRIIAAQIKQGWDEADWDQWKKAGSPPDNEVIDNYLANNPDSSKDTLLRQGVVLQLMNAKTEAARNYASVLKDKQAAKAAREGKKWYKALKFISTMGAGVVGGTIIRNTAQQLAIMAGAQSARLVGGIGGVAAGGIVGGVSGFFRGRGRAIAKIYEGSAVLQEINAIRSGSDPMAAEKALAIAERSLKENKILGKEDECLALIREIAEIKAEQEFQTAVDNMTRIQGESDQQFLARTLRELRTQQASATGSQGEREQAVKQYFKEKNKAVYGSKELWLETAKGAAIGAVGGGIFGALFTSPGVESQIHAHAQAIAPTHLNNTAEVAKTWQALQDITRAHGNTTESNQLITEYIKNHNFNFKDLSTLVAQNAELAGKPEFADVLHRQEWLAQQIAYRLGLDLSYNVPGHGTLAHAMQETMRNYLSNNNISMDSSGIFHASGHALSGAGDTGTRALFHLASHPNVLSNPHHWQVFQNIVSQADQLGGHNLTAEIIHGGTPWWQPFTGGPLLQGGEMSNDMSASMREFLTHVPKNPKNVWDILKNLAMIGFTSETPWFPFMMWNMTSAEAKTLAEKGGKVFEKAKTVAEKILSKESKKPETGPKSEVLSYDKRLSDYFNDIKSYPETHAGDPSLETVTNQAKSFKQRLWAKHGHFVFLPAEGNQPARALRIWTRGGSEANPNRKIDMANDEKKQGLNGSVIPNSKTEGLLDVGRIMVVEYDIKKLFRQDMKAGFFGISANPADSDLLEKTWDAPFWGTQDLIQGRTAGPDGKPAYRPLDFEDVFNQLNGNNREQLFVSPLETDLYAKAISERWIKPGEVPAGGIKKFMTDKNEEFVAQGSAKNTTEPDAESDTQTTTENTTENPPVIKLTIDPIDRAKTLNELVDEQNDYELQLEQLSAALKRSEEQAKFLSNNLPDVNQLRQGLIKDRARLTEANRQLAERAREIDAIRKDQAVQNGNIPETVASLPEKLLTKPLIGNDGKPTLLSQLSREQLISLREELQQDFRTAQARWSAPIINPSNAVRLGTPLDRYEADIKTVDSLITKKDELAANTRLAPEQVASQRPGATENGSTSKARIVINRNRSYNGGGGPGPATFSSAKAPQENVVQTVEPNTNEATT